MLFHSWEFLVFFIVVYVVYLSVKKTRFMNLWLLTASYFFYGWWNPLYLLLIVYSTAIDYLAGLRMAATGRKRAWLAFSICNNLALLGFFKYAGFVTENLNWLLGQIGVSYVLPAPDVLLPLGISFYTFQSLSYTIDLYRERLQPERSFIRFASFVALFPQLVAGPIERAGALLPQLEQGPRVRLTDISDGLSLFLVGLFKKVAMADFLARYVDPIYEAPGEFGRASLILATYAFAWQIYFDFSGYTDMARGVAKAMGFRLRLNFNNPYTATGLRDFWRRWHISLSTWFRDYVYIPLGGNRKGKFTAHCNIIITMVIAGIWHGAAWTFVLWGGVHAMGLVLTRELEGTALYGRVPTFIKQVLTFHLVCLGWVFFRARDVGEAFLILGRIAGGPAGGLREAPIMMFMMILAVWLYQIVYNSPLQGVLQWRPVRVGLMLAMLTYLVVFATSAHEPFIYFAF